MERRNIPWKAEWKASELDPGPLSPEEEALVPALKVENQEFLKKHPWKASKRSRPQTPLLSWGVPLAAAAAVLLAVSLPFTGPDAATGLERIKGSSNAVLSVYRQSPTGPEKLVSGTAVHPGEVLQASYKIVQPSQGVLVSVDGNRNVTVHLSGAGRSVPLISGGEQPLAFSYELDQAPRFEAFFLLVSNRAFDLEPIRQVLKTAALDSLKPDVFGPDIAFTVVSLKKESAK